VFAVLTADGVRVLLGQPQLLDLLHQGGLVQVVLGSVGHDEVDGSDGALVSNSQEK
jgi:hypothetical protein